MKRHYAYLTLAVLASLGLASTPAFAGFAQGNQVTMDDKPVFKIAAGAEGFTPEHRAWMAQDALDAALLLSDAKPDCVSVERVNGAITLQLGGRLVATADAESARLENTTPENLANQWAEGVRNFLSNRTETDRYIAMLRNGHSIQADVAFVERKLYAPPKFAFTASLCKQLDMASLTPNQSIEAVLDNDVPLVGHFAIPAGSTVTGEVLEASNGNYTLHFTKLCTPGGTAMPIDAVAIQGTVIESNGPHRVCTQSIPSAMSNGIPQIAGRLPAGIGIGDIAESSTQTLVLNKDSAAMVANAPVTLLFQEATPVAVVTRDIAM